MLEEAESIGARGVIGVSIESSEPAGGHRNDRVPRPRTRIKVDGGPPPGRRSAVDHLPRPVSG